MKAEKWDVCMVKYTIMVPVQNKYCARTNKFPRCLDQPERPSGRWPNQQVWLTRDSHDDDRFFCFFLKVERNPTTEDFLKHRSSTSESVSVCVRMWVLPVCYKVMVEIWQPGVSYRFLPGSTQHGTETLHEQKNLHPVISRSHPPNTKMTGTESREPRTLQTHWWASVECTVLVDSFNRCIFNKVTSDTRNLQSRNLPASRTMQANSEWYLMR